MSKRILILSHISSGPMQLRNSRHKVVTCNDPGEALGILMGGSSAFGKEDYAKTGKVRPEIFLLDSSFFESYEGFELLEIIRKYYSLQNVRIYILDQKITPLDPAIFTRYKILGTLPPNYDLDHLMEVSIPHQTPADGTTGAFLSAGFFALYKDWISSALNAIKTKTFIIPSIKAAVAGKVAVAASCAVAVTLAVVPASPANKTAALLESEVTTPVKKVTVNPEPVVAAIVDSFPEAEMKEQPKPEIKRKPAKVVKIEKNPAVIETEITPVQKPERKFRIGVEEAEEPAAAVVTQ